MLFKDTSGQVSTELILLMACVMMGVLVSLSMYKDYLENFANEINNTEVQNLKNKIDEINDLLK